MVMQIMILYAGPRIAVFPFCAPLCDCRLRTDECLILPSDLLGDRHTDPTVLIFMGRGFVA